MVTLFVTSSEKGSGKTTLCAGLGKHLRTNGKKVGFFKPLIGGNSLPADGIESDANFMKHILALEEPVNLLCPVFSDENNLHNGLKESYDKVSQGKDVVIIEDASRLSQSSYGIVESLNARMIVVEAYSKELQKTMNSYKNFGKYLLGVV
ncbi:MAG: AAA family ATPase, partial [Chloroflexota bacterium]